MNHLVRGCFVPLASPCADREAVCKCVCSNSLQRIAAVYCRIVNCLLHALSTVFLHAGCSGKFLNFCAGVGGWLDSGRCWPRALQQTPACIHCRCAVSKHCEVSISDALEAMAVLM
jgi:hypothetical protein